MGRSETQRQAAPGRPQRRTQAERSALTREKVMQAVVDCIVEEGLQNTTAARIAQRSGVTWGAIVHQFGDKDSLLLAVMERSFEDLSRSLREAVAQGAPSPGERVSLLVDETWKRLNAPPFRAFLEIVLNSRLASDSALRSRQEELIVVLTRGIWSELFGAFGMAPATLDTARKLTFATLLGLAIQGMMGPRRPRSRRELEALKQNLLRTLELGPQ